MSYDIVEHHNMVQQLLDAGLPFCVITLIDIRGSIRRSSEPKPL